MANHSSQALAATLGRVKSAEPKPSTTPSLDTLWKNWIHKESLRRFVELHSYVKTTQVKAPVNHLQTLRNLPSPRPPSLLHARRHVPLATRVEPPHRPTAIW